MALIKCPECGKEVSDKAQSCPNCGFPLSTDIKVCPECGATAPADADTCSTCGYPFVDNATTQSVVAGSKHSVSKKNRTLGIAAIVVGVIFLFVGFNTLTADDLKFYKDHLQECVDAQSEVDAMSYGAFGGTYKSISSDYDSLISYDKKKITGLTVKGMSFIGVGAFFIVCGILLAKGVWAILKEDVDGINQVS